MTVKGQLCCLKRWSHETCFHNVSNMFSVWSCLTSAYAFNAVWWPHRSIGHNAFCVDKQIKYYAVLFILAMITAFLPCGVKRIRHCQATLHQKNIRNMSACCLISLKRLLCIQPAKFMHHSGDTNLIWDTRYHLSAKAVSHLEAC